ncbi:dihydroxyacetone kinase subunit DhaL [Aureibacter tunicatorum]|uniref:Dihydroxyacetone kinase-like protein n=1 Tax=Aureibacter tunicatorum TaxID=866807 RepID=A0AAE4BVD4_9BACT|nr:dihydroxyacetone kinase subunit DhaL [Aureibacter tunicatorum]MDR6241782.1 dihydroxyacetone kinase-like protein [Aureibacter tunicatorum]BDD07426.1 dihydroxyacetone kinase subunit L [Aureibacter tunicatorum]
MEKLSIDQFKKMLDRAFENIKAREVEFSELDAICGDGDHGTAIVAAFNALHKEAEDGKEFKTLLSDMAFRAMTEASGSTSTLIGSFFMGMSDQAEGDALSPKQVVGMFEAGLKGVQEQTSAKVGDKTMMDALVPAVEAMKMADASTIESVFKAAAEAAENGAEQTANLKANFGRARNLGERSIGHKDPGATSWACMIESFNQSLLAQA